MPGLSLGGRHVATNLTACCVECNTEKGDMPTVEWLEIMAKRICGVPSFSTLLSQWGRV